MIPLTIRDGLLQDAFQLLSSIPEFENIPSVEIINERLSGVQHLILTAYLDGRVVGCKIGYERDGQFYSWLGAVHPEYRRQKIAETLAGYQERKAKEWGYASIWMKTRNCFPAMVIMAVSRGFNVIGIDPRDEIGQHRIILAKSI